MPTNTRIVIAIGGNALLQAGQQGTYQEQTENIEPCVQLIAQLALQGYSILITHGNGPQVGNRYLQGTLTSSSLPAMPLDVYGAETQGQIGYIIESALTNCLRSLGSKKEVVTLLTRVEVAANDPAFCKPTKPIGPFYTQQQITQQCNSSIYPYVEDSGRGYRRVVPSPAPAHILSSQVIQSLLKAGMIVIAGGGGGIPVCKKADGTYHGLEAVIDKDATSALLAQEVQADILLILTGTPQVAINFGTPQQQCLSSLSLKEAAQYLKEGHFPPGSMGPKIEAAISFVKNTNKTAYITTLDQASLALAGKGGTRITP